MNRFGCFILADTSHTLALGFMQVVQQHDVATLLKNMLHQVQLYTPINGGLQ